MFDQKIRDMVQIDTQVFCNCTQVSENRFFESFLLKKNIKSAFMSQLRKNIYMNKKN